jgi:tRNA pseudouridine13 synthase
VSDADGVSAALGCGPLVTATALAAEAGELAARMESLPRALGPVLGTALLRCQPDDFQVDEELGFEPDGGGEHLWLWIEKRGINTEHVARDLARWAGLPQREIGFAGLKDRHALTRQWFSVPGAARLEQALTRIQALSWNVLVVRRHGRKLKRGALSGNRFKITLREVGVADGELQQRLTKASSSGVPNYFTEQRFGRDNLAAAARMLAGERVSRDGVARGLLLSAARAALFNVVLASRVDASSWNQLLPGEAVQLAGSRSFFVADDGDDGLVGRLAAGDVMPTGPLWGRSGAASRDRAAQLEVASLAPFRAFCEALERAGLEAARRPLLLRPRNMSWVSTAPGVYTVSFALPAGAYATAVLREVVAYSDASKRVE